MKLPQQCPINGESLRDRSVPFNMRKHQKLFSTAIQVGTVDEGEDVGRPIWQCPHCQGVWIRRADGTIVETLIP